MHFVSIKKKLLNNTLLLLVGAFCLILALVIGLNLYQSQQNLHHSQQTLQKHLNDKGIMLLHSTKFALTGMIEDNAISQISEFISTTVNQDSEIVYGYFMDTRKKIWTSSGPEELLSAIPEIHQERLLQSTSTLTIPKEMSLWYFIAFSFIGCVKLGQPLLELNLMDESNNGVLQQTQLYLPSS